MTKRRAYEWGTYGDTKESILACFEWKDDNSVHVYIFRGQQINSFPKEKLPAWTKYEERIDFANPHDHIVYNAGASSISPEYCRLKRPDIVNNFHKRQYHDALSEKHANILFTELDILHRDILSLRSYNKNVHDRYKALQQRIKDAKEEFREDTSKNKGIIRGINPQDAYKLNEKSQKMWEVLSKLLDQQKKQGEESYQAINPKIQEFSNLVAHSTDFKLLQVKSDEIRSFLECNYFQYSQQKELKERFYSANNIFWDRKKQASEKFKADNEAAYNNLSPRIEAVLKLVSVTTEWGEAFGLLKNISDDLSNFTLSGEKRKNLRERLNTAYDTLKYRKTEQERKYNSACSDNEIRLNYELNENSNWYRCSDDELKQAIEVYTNIKNNILQTRPLRKEQKDKLLERVKGALDSFYERNRIYKEFKNAEYIRKQSEWRQRQQESIRKLESAIQGKEEQLLKLHDVIRRKEDALNRVKHTDTKYSIQNDISEISQKIREVEYKLQDMRVSLREKENKL